MMTPEQRLRELRQLHVERPLDRSEYLEMAWCFEQLGDPANASLWRREAARNPRADATPVRIVGPVEVVQADPPHTSGWLILVAALVGLLVPIGAIAIGIAEVCVPRTRELGGYSIAFGILGWTVGCGLVMLAFP